MRGKLQFGPFHLDTETLELRKHGALVRLQEQPLRVLATLVERPGEILSREVLRERIWGSDTFVDFEQSLNKAVNRLREALEDNAGEPHFIETVPRRGYRFIAPVSEIPTPQPTAPSTLSVRPAKAKLPVALTLALVALLVIIGTAATVLLRRTRQPVIAEPKVIAPAVLCCPRLSRDGKLLAFASTSGASRARLWVKQTAGGDAIPVTDGSEDALGEDFSPDGTHLVFWSETGIRLAPTLSGESKILIRNGGYPLFSPDGRQILYWAPPAARMISAEGGEPISVPLNRTFLVHRNPMWSPDGNFVLFYGRRKQEPSKAEGYWITALHSEDAKPVAFAPGSSLEGQDFTAHAWVRDNQDAEWIYLSTQEQQAWRLYRVRTSPGHQVQGEPELVTSGADLLGFSASVTEGGTLAYPTVTFTDSISEMAIGGAGGTSSPVRQLPLPEGGSYQSPSLSHDGKWMAYNSAALGSASTIRLRNLETGTDRLVDDTGRQPGWAAETTLSPDATRVAFERACIDLRWREEGDPMPCTFVVPAAGGNAQQVCVACTPRGWVSDGSSLLVQYYNPDQAWPHRIDIVNLSSKIEKEFLSLPDASVYHAYLSWDDRWVVFKTQSNEDSRVWPLWIAPVRNGVAGGRAEWISLTDGRYADDKPQFSSDGNTIYFTSQRDGYRCIWAQHLDPRTRHPVGEPVAYAHFHTIAEGMGGPFSSTNGSDLTVARNRLAINLPEGHNRIWMTQMR